MSPKTRKTRSLDSEELNEMKCLCSVQLCWEITGTEGELDEETPGGDDDQDGGVGPGLHERQTEGRALAALAVHI